MSYLKRRKFIIIVCLTLIVAALFTGCDWFNASARVEKQLELGVKYLSENKYEEAVLAYQEVIKIDKKSVPAYKGLSVAYTLQEKPEQAEQALQDGLKQVTGSKPLKIALAGLFVDRNKKDQAEAVYNEIITLDGNYLPAYQAYARLLVGLNRQNDAVALLEKAAAGNAGQYIICNLLAEQHVKSGSREKALSAISQSLSTEPNQAGSYKLLAELYSGRWTDLIALGDQYIQQGRNMPGQIIKLTGLYQSGKYDDMVKLYDQLTSDQKANPKIGLLAAQAYLKLGQKDQGVNLVKDIKPESIKDAALMAEIANLCLEAADKETARSLALQGISLDDTVIDNYIVLSRSYQDEDKSQSDIWQAKYLLGSVFGAREAKKEQELLIKKKQEIIPIETQNQEKEISMDPDTRKKLNTFFSNFSEAWLEPFEKGQISDKELVRFGIRHNWINNMRLFRIEGSKAYIEENIVYSSISKYFGIAVNKPVSDFSYSNGFYQTTAASGEAYRFSQIVRLVDKGNGYYAANVNIYEASSGFTGNPHGTIDEWKSYSGNPYDIPKLIGNMNATIRKAEDNRYILVDYLPSQ